MNSNPFLTAAFLSLVVFASAQTPDSSTAKPLPMDPSGNASPAQAPAQETDVEITTPEAKQARDEFNKLSAEKREAYLKMLAEGQRYMGERRVTEALQKFNEAEAVYPLNANLLNLKGSALVNLRDFERAAKYFDQATRIYPDFWQAHFNLAEMNFVRSKWDEAEKGFRALLKDEKKIAGPTRRLVDYKIILCLIKKGKADEAKKLIANYDIYDDSPIFYYATAAWHFERNERKEAEEWVTNARGVYSAQLNSIFEDSLTELGWLFVF